MNVLLTSAGRRSYLVRYFQEAMEGQGQVFAANSVADSTALAVADRAFVSPLIRSEEYVPWLLELCRTNDVGLVVPLFDLDLQQLAHARPLFEDAGVTVVVSSPSVVELCQDKWRASEYLVANGLQSPDAYLSVDDALSAGIQFPAFVKPRWGTGSIGVHRVDAIEDLQALYDLADRAVRASYVGEFDDAKESRVLVQQAAVGVEYGLDVINDLQGNYVCTFVKRKLAMRSGETDGAVTVEDPELAKLGETLGTKLRHIGVLDVDVIRTDEGCQIIEMNPRFGGGYPFSHVAGADIPRALMAWAQRLEPQDDWLKIRTGVKALKEITLLVI